MKIENVEMQDKIGVTIIEISSNKIIPIRSKLILLYDNKEHYFEVINVRTRNTFLHIKAKEIGYWCDRFNSERMKNLDIRQLIGLEINIAAD